ncbi:hypothetical protein [Novosphingobium sp. JCM 18896]|uniref:hypothetical protein n=1 Tax=Novosphingobium sp. JCM 18896 TaxID=2989731 RepID=UPI0022227884|nr:hypothetical protein [Novosphingobium sp. JCM 18896]MCW1432007.1 hypothetical protein [Novosphingobium sp. JCM 18896]
MQVSLFRALKSANISDEAAERVVHAFEEHIEMAVAEAMKHYDDRITAMQSIIEAKLDAGFKGIEARMAGLDGKISGVDGKIAGIDGKFEGKFAGIQTSIDVMKWVLIAQGTLILLAGTIAGYVKIIS